MSSATRGALLLAVGALLAFLVLRGAADNEQQLVVSGAANPTPTVVVDLEVDPEDSVPVATETPVIDTSTARNNSEVSVLVANGTEVNGQATRLTSALRNQGFRTREPRNADAQPASVIYYRPGFAAEAAVVSNVLGGGIDIESMPVPDPSIGENIDLVPVDVLVLVGDDELSQ